MKKLNLILATVILLIILSSCGGVTGMWIEEFPADYSGEEVWLTLDEEGAFEFIVLSAPYTISMYYTGTYTADEKAKTITLNAAKVTDGTRISAGSEYVWDDTDTKIEATYEVSGSELILTIGSKVITLTEREQPVELMRSLTSEENQILK